jgi:hypothetical protein
MVETGFETVDFTQWSIFNVEDLEDVGETELVNIALQNLYADSTYEENGRNFTVGRFNDVSVKLAVAGSEAAVILYGTADLDGVISD